MQGWLVNNHADTQIAVHLYTLYQGAIKVQMELLVSPCEGVAACARARLYCRMEKRVWIMLHGILTSVNRPTMTVIQKAAHSTLLRWSTTSCRQV